VKFQIGDKVRDGHAHRHRHRRRHRPHPSQVRHGWIARGVPVGTGQDPLPTSEPRSNNEMISILSHDLRQSMRDCRIRAALGTNARPERTESD
jgi:hypothetical protein